MYVWRRRLFSPTLGGARKDQRFIHTAPRSEPMPSAPPASLNASIAGDSPPNSLPASQLPSRCASPLRTRLDQPHSFAASLKTTGRQPTKPSECPTHYYQLDTSIASRSPPDSLPASQRSSRCASPLRTRHNQTHTFAASLKTSGRRPDPPAECPAHYYQIDLSTLRKNSALFGTEPKMPNSARSDGGESSLNSGRSSLNSARSSARAASEGATPRSASLLGPDWDVGVRKHLFAATLSSSSRNLDRSPAPPCPVHCYSGQGTPYDRTPATFGKARTGRGLLAPIESSPLPGPEFDRPQRRGTYSCTFGSAPRPEGALMLSRSGLAASPSAPRALRAPPGSAPRPTSVYMRRKIENAATAAGSPPVTSPAPPDSTRAAPPAPLRRTRLAPVKRLPEVAAENPTRSSPAEAAPKAQRVLFASSTRSFSPPPFRPVAAAA